ncbi:MAG TPA: DUF3693 domain-containing protein [Rhodocyclaceae bacterium]|nr:DUF3693 domain-containing protein [Rhodocyclaceae bacterium]
MKTTVEFLDEISSRSDGISDYAIAKQLGITRQSVSNYRTGKSHFDETTAYKAAKLLDLEPAYVLACSQAERAKTPEIQAVWKSVAERIRIM